MASSLDYGARSHVGLVRTNNEDNFLADAKLGLWLIADGMGGHDAGEVASQIVTDSVSQAVRNKIALNDAIYQSHFDVKDAAKRNIGSPNMGTTIVALLCQADKYQVSWVGDSRAYLWDPHKHPIQQISKDHSYVQSLVDSGMITEEEMHNHPQKNIITQSLGVAALDTVTVDSIHGHWQAGQKILLCSDGLTDLVSNDEIAHIIRKNQQKSSQEIADVLVQAALDKGGVDNVTVEIISAPNTHTATNTASSQARADQSYRIVMSVTALAFILFTAWITLK